MDLEGFSFRGKERVVGTWLLQVMTKLSTFTTGKLHFRILVWLIWQPFFYRHAEIVDQIRLPGMCVCFGWDKDGDLLAAITDKSSNLLIWDSNTRRSQWFDSSIRDPLNVLVWSKTGPHLAIGSYRYIKQLNIGLEFLPSKQYWFNKPGNFASDYELKSNNLQPL